MQSQHLLPPIVSVCLAALAGAQDIVSNGLSATAALNPGGQILTLSDGSYVTNDGAEVVLVGGGAATVLHTFDPSVFTGAFAISPDESLLLVGESSNGDVFRVPLDGTGGVYLTTLSFNFDAAFEDDQSAIVSAATCGFGCGNDIVRVDISDGTTTFLANVAGASGPLEVGVDGDVFYATSSGDFPPPAGSTSVLRFAADDLDGSSLLTEADAQVVAAGFDGASSMAYEAKSDALFLAETSFGTGVNRVQRIDPSNGATRVLVEGPAFQWIAGLEVDSGAGDGVFFPYQPSGNGELYYTRTDFATYSERQVVETVRPDLSLATSASGQTLETSITGGPSDGLFVVYASPSVLSSPTETTYDFGGVPAVHSPLFVPTLVRLDAVGALDAAGDGQLSFSVPSGLAIDFDLQAIVLDATGIVGSSDTELF